jgi:hypothetical protein
MNSIHWMSLHVFYSGDVDKFLVDCWDPLLADAKYRGSKLESFFLRYWNGGPHVRIRFRANDLTEDETREMRFQLQTYLDRQPRVNSSHSEYSLAVGKIGEAEARLRDITAYVPETPEELRQDGTIEERSYSFDATRYGGITTRTFVEEHFCRSSELAMLIVSFTIDRPSLRITIALYLCATIFCMPPESRVAAITMLKKMSEVFSLFYLEISDNNFHAHGFPSLNELSQSLMDLKFQIDNGRRASSHFGPVGDVLDFWQEELLLRYREVEGLRSAGLTQLNPMAFLLDCVHLLNNRLGIPVSVECYLYYLVAKIACKQDSSA